MPSSLTYYCLGDRTSEHLSVKGKNFTHIKFTRPVNLSLIDRIELLLYVQLKSTLLIQLDY